jgi:protein CWC15
LQEKTGGTASLTEHGHEHAQEEVSKASAGLDADDDDDDDDDEGIKNVDDADDSDEDAGGDDEDDEDDDGDDDDDEDDTAELLRELEKIKRERAEEKERLEREKREEEERVRTEEMLTGNPLLNDGASNFASGSGNGVVSKDFSVKRRWDDDVVFSKLLDSSILFEFRLILI